MSTVGDAVRELDALQPEIAPPGYSCHITWPEHVKQIAPGVWLEDLGHQPAINAHVVVESHWHTYALEPYHPMVSVLPDQLRVHLVCQHVDQDGMRCEQSIFWGAGGVAIGARGYAVPSVGVDGR